MFKKIAFLVCAIAVAGIAQQANASVLGFNQGELLGMTVVSSTGFSTTAAVTGDMTPGPGAGAFSDGGTRVMSGVAGSAATLDPGGFVYYGLNAGDLADFNSAATSADTLRMVGYNDNDDAWNLGIWYTVAGSEELFTSTVLAGGSATLTLGLTDAEITGAGVYVGQTPSGETDVFHVSWAAPEPGTLAIWSVLGVMGVVTRRRRA